MSPWKARASNTIRITATERQLSHCVPVSGTNAQLGPITVQPKWRANSIGWSDDGEAGVNLKSNNNTDSVRAEIARRTAER